MKSISKYLSFFGTAALLLIGCEKSEPTAFHAEPAVVFDYTTTEGQVNRFSFLGKSEDVGYVKIPVIINGFPSDQDRSFEVEVVTDTITNADPSDYEILPSIIQGGRVKDTLVVQVFKKAELDTTTKYLYLRVAANENFVPGVLEKQFMQIQWSNQAIMPTWGTYFRTFISATGSTRAYRIFVETTGLTNFTAAEYRIYQQAGAEVLGKAFGDYIREWNSQNPTEPLVHDDGAQKGQPIVPRY